MSVIGIKSELERLGLKSPKGNDHWCKRTIDVMLSNEKYMGDVKLLDNGKHDDYYLAEGAHQAIIPKMMFYAVQIEKERRSNVVRSDEEGIYTKEQEIQLSNQHKQIAYLKWYFVGRWLYLFGSPNQMINEANLLNNNF